jgi:hypothetical protein
MLDRSNTYRILSITLLLVVFASILIINVKTPMIGEDYALSLRLYDKENSLIFQKLGLIYQRISNQFTNWNSRIGEQLAILFLGFDKTIFDILNSLAFICLALITVRFGIGEIKRISIVRLTFYTSLTLMIYFVFLPALGESVFWLTGSTNYLWGLVIFLLFLIPFFHIFETPKEAEQRLPLYYLIIGFLAGMTNENTVPFSILFCCLIIINLGLNKAPVHFTFYLGLFLHCLGYAVLFFSPSTKIRTEYYNQVFGVIKPSLSDYLDRLTNILTSFFHYYKSYIFLMLILFTLFIVLHSISKNKFRSLLRSRPMALLVFVLFSFGTVIDMIAVPYYEVRSSIFVFFAITSLVVSIIDSFYFSLRSLFILSVLVLSLGWLFTINTIRITYNRFNADFLQREANLLTNAGLSKTIIVPKFSAIQDQRLLNSREFYLVFNNLDYSAYYGFDEIQIK